MNYTHTNSKDFGAQAKQKLDEIVSEKNKTDKYMAAGNNLLCPMWQSMTQTQ
jgi:hypothetical protein